MDAAAIKLVLESHVKWLKGEEGGKKADLSGADLSGANLDFSCWPLWCGSLSIGKVDDRIVLQLFAHVARLPVEGLSPEVSALVSRLPRLAKDGFCKYQGMVKPMEAEAA